MSAAILESRLGANLSVNSPPPFAYSRVPTTLQTVREERPSTSDDDARRSSSVDTLVDEPAANYLPNSNPSLRQTDTLTSSSSKDAKSIRKAKSNGLGLCGIFKGMVNTELDISNFEDLIHPKREELRTSALQVEVEIVKEEWATNPARMGTLKRASKFFAGRKRSGSTATTASKVGVAL